MEITGGWMIYLFGCVGGVAVELLRWWKLRESLEFPVFVRKPTYWILTILMILLGGVVAIAYGMEKSTAILSMNLGASAPARTRRNRRGAGSPFLAGSPRR